MRIPWEALSLLNHDARMSIREIADRIGVSPENMQARVRKMEGSGAIQCYTILLDHVKAGYPRHRTLIKFKNLNEKEERRFFTYCNYHANIVHHLKVLGNWDLVIDIEVEDMEGLRKVLIDIKYKFSDIIARIEPTYIYKIDRFRDIPEEYPELSG